MDNLTKAKGIDIVYFLSKSGIKPKRESKNRSYYLSPFREEKDPSFIVYKDENRFYDWGASWGGDVIDIAEKLWGCTTSEAIKKLLGDEDVPIYHKRPSVIDRTPGIEVLEERSVVTNEALIDYMERIRKIPIEVVNLYCQEVTFQFPNNRAVRHYGVGMQNDLGGYSIRSTWFKGATSPAGIKTVKATQSDGCVLFEGFIDFLSYVVMYGEPEHTTIILNSTVFLHMMLDILQGFGFVHVWLDNDAAGDVAVDELIFNKVSVRDERERFKGYNDLNEYLQAES